MTEKEAMEKICFLRDDFQCVSCMGSECMAWRWQSEWEPTPDGKPSKTGVSMVCEDTGLMSVLVPGGYCGLAGKP